MRNTRNKRRLAEIQDNFDGESSQSSNRERNQGNINEEYISQVSQEIEGRISKKLSQEFSKRESRILGALAKLDHFLTNPADGNGESTPKQKSTSVRGISGTQSSNMPEREGCVLNGLDARYHIPDPSLIRNFENQLNAFKFVYWSVKDQYNASAPALKQHWFSADQWKKCTDQALKQH